MKHYVTKNVKHEFTQKALQDIFSKKCKIKKKSCPPIFYEIRMTHAYTPTYLIFSQNKNIYVQHDGCVYM